jgi:hypothetical protein
MADPKNEELNAQKSINEQLGEGNTLRERGMKAMQDLLFTQQSYVESLKEAYGINTKLTENEASNLKLVKEITRAINGQNVGLNSVKEKQKEIEKNEKLILKGKISTDLLNDEGVAGALKALEVQEAEARTLEDMLALYISGGAISKAKIQDQRNAVALAEAATATAQKGLDKDQEAALYQQSSIENLKRANKQRREELVTLEEIESSLGLTYKLAEGLSKIPGMGGLAASAKKVQEEIAKSVSEGNKLPTRWKSFGMMLTEFGKDFKTNLTDPATIMTFAVVQLATVFKTLDTLTSGTARNFGISNEAAREMNKELGLVAHNTNDAFVTTVALNKTVVELNNRYGTQAKLTDEMAVSYTQLTKEAGLSVEAAGALTDTTFLTRKGVKETAEEYRGQIKILKATTGLALNEKQIMESIKDVSAATKLQLGGSATAISTAVFQAKALGVELKTLESISSSLLNFQSSIEDELAAELLTGKQLNLEGARYAALIGDQGRLAEELAANFGTAADFQSMNVIQQEAMAKAVGLNRDSLADSLMKREAMAALSEFEGANEKEKYEDAVRRLGVDGARAELGNKALADQMESVSLQERLAAAGEKFQEALIPLAEKIMPVLEKTFKFVGDHMDDIVLALKFIIPAMLAYKAAAIATSVATIAAASATTGGAAGIAALIAGAGALAFLTSVGDVAMKGDGGPVITSPQLGGLRLNKKDDLMAGPGLIDDYNTLKKSRNTGVEQAIKNHVNITPSDTKITLNLNGQAIANGNARQAYEAGSTVKALGGRVDYSATV